MGKENYIYKLKQAHTLGEMDFKQGQEFNIINEVVYMEGYPLPLGLQGTVLGWIRNNPNFFAVYNRDY
jgi:hypothetical protein